MAFQPGAGLMVVRGTAGSLFFKDMQQWIALVMTLHTHTPVLYVTDPRGLPVRSVAFYRAQAGEALIERADRSAYDVATRRVDRWDPRLWAASNQAGTPSNVSSIHSLSGLELFSDSVDAGWRAQLICESGECDRRWDAKGQGQRFQYDDSRRLLAVFESDGVNETCAERLDYGDSTTVSGNQCGQLIRHDDPVGSLLNAQFGLSGEVVRQSRRLLNDLEIPDWPVALNERDALLEAGEGAVTGWRFGPLGDALEQTDAMGNVQFFTQTLYGQLERTVLRLNGRSAQTLVSDIRYDAQQRIESETLGNGVITALDYDPIDGRLIQLRADHGRLQNLHYAYDPVGNVVSIEDAAQPSRFFSNQQIEPLRTFSYDTLYQLIEATGFEAAANNRGPSGVSSFATANELSNYTQRYEYDAGGNLQRLVHGGWQNHTHVFATSRHSNRTLIQTGAQPPTEQQIAAGFDGNGNMRELAPGQGLSWDQRNQLSEVTPVIRESSDNDREIYQYDAAGMRVRKVRTAVAKAATHINEARYLPGLEVRTDSATGQALQVIVAKAGRSEVRVLHWQAGRPADIANDQIRYSLTDHLGSTALELDQHAQLISQEVYYPYGETAWFAARSEVEAKYKTVRYSGKERDATGLYYYGLRYYAPGWMRWVNPDPAEDVDGTNRYLFLRANPVSALDVEGTILRWFTDINDSPLHRLQHDGFQPRYRGVSEMLSANETGRVFAIDTALSTARELIQEEIAQLSQGESQRLSDFLAMVPGVSVPDQLVSSVISGYQKIHDELSRYQHGGDLRDSLYFVETTRADAPKAYAMMVPGDSKRRIFLTDLFLSRHVMANVSTLVHELSHVALDTNDKFYYPKGNLNSDRSCEDVKVELAAISKRATEKNRSLQPDNALAHSADSTFASGVIRVADFWGHYLIARPLSDERHQTLHLYSAGRSSGSGAQRRLDGR